MNGSADDTDEADLRGFYFACGKSFFGHKLHKFSQIEYSLRSGMRVRAQTKFVHLICENL